MTEAERLLTEIGDLEQKAADARRSTGLKMPPIATAPTSRCSNRSCWR